MSTMRQPESLYTLAVADEHTTLADTVASAIAEEALDDVEWRALYDAVLDSRSGHPETLYKVVCAHGFEEYGARGLDFTVTPERAVEDLLQRSRELGVPGTAASANDLVAAGVGVDVWRAAIGADDLSRAASMGPCAVRALAAVIARALGEPIEVALVDTPPDPQFDTARLTAAISRASDWAFLYAGPDLASRVLRSAASDLAYRADSRCTTLHAASRLARCAAA